MVLELVDVNKQFDNFHLKDFSLELSENEIYALIGESGSGKSTVLRMVAGFETPSSGVIKVNDKALFNSSSNVSPDKRNIGMVFQDHALFPHLTVYQNIAFGIKDKKTAKAKVDGLLRLIRLNGYEDRYPSELSGGERQRVAIARALAPEPSVILLDEPFSNLDALLKDQIRQEIKHIIKQAGIPAIFVTHDINDVYYAADKVHVLRHGITQQIGKPNEVYLTPSNAYVGHLFGKLNELAFSSETGKLKTDFGVLDFEVKQSAGKMLFRPEAIDFDKNGLSGIVTGQNDLGPFYEYVLRNGESLLSVRTPKAISFVEGQEVQFYIDTEMVQFV